MHNAIILLSRIMQKLMQSLNRTFSSFLSLYTKENKNCTCLHTFHILNIEVRLRYIKPMVRSYNNIISYGVNLTQKSSFDGRATPVYRHKLSLLMVKKSPLYFLRRNNVFQNDHPFKDNKQDCERLILNP